MKDKLSLWFPELNENQIKKLFRMFERASLHARADEIQHVMDSYKFSQRTREKLEVRLFIYKGKLENEPK